MAILPWWAESAIRAGWEDLRVTEAAIKVPAVGGPTEETWNSVFQLKRFPASSDKYVYFSTQLPHGREPHSDLRFHVHWLPEAYLAGTATVKWKLDWSAASMNGVLPAAATTSMTTTGTPIAANTHKLTSETTIPGTALDKSAFVVCRLCRQGSADTFTGNVMLLGSDFHYMQARFGSQTTY